MCERAIKLQSYVDDWLEAEISLKTTSRSSGGLGENDTTIVDSKDFKKLRLTQAEWYHLKAITDMLSNFKQATMALSENGTPQVRHIWMMYNRLFDFLDMMNTELGENSEDTEQQDWPQVVQTAAEAGRNKLKKYYAKTGGSAGLIFNMATVLDPWQKLTAYEVHLSHCFITAPRLRSNRTKHGTQRTGTRIACNSSNISTRSTTIGIAGLPLLHLEHTSATTAASGSGDLSQQPPRQEALILASLPRMRCVGQQHLKATGTCQPHPLQAQEVISLHGGKRMRHCTLA